MASEHEQFMRMALEEAGRARGEGNIGVGSVIVRDGVVVGRGRNTVNSTRDITAHAETVALRNMSLSMGAPIPPYLSSPGLLAGPRPLHDRGALPDVRLRLLHRRRVAPS